MLGEPDWRGHVEPQEADDFLFTRFNEDFLQRQGLTESEWKELKRKLLAEEIPAAIVRDLIIAALQSDAGVKNCEPFS